MACFRWDQGSPALGGFKVLSLTLPDFSNMRIIKEMANSRRPTANPAMMQCCP
jgi:hypothetical protein